MKISESGTSSPPRLGRRAAVVCGALALAVVLGLTPLVRRWVLEARLLRVLESDWEDLEAVETLISLGSARVVPHLLRIENGKYRYSSSASIRGKQVRWQQAFSSIYEKRPRQTMNILRRILRGEERGPRVLAAEKLRDIGPAAEFTAPDLIAALEDPDPALRLAAAEALLELGASVVENLS